MSMIEVEPGIKLFVQDWGEGHPVFFVHGFPFSHRIFEYQMLSLAKKGYRAIAIDLRGYGQSDKPWKGNDYDTHVQDIHKVMVALDLHEVILVGFSMGGAIAAHTAATVTDGRIKKLALLSAAAPIAAGSAPEKQMLSNFIAGAQADQAAFVHAFIQNAFQTPPSAQLAAFLDGLGTTASQWAVIRSLEELRDRSLVADMGKIHVPTLICHGVPDKAVPFAAGEAQHQMISGATLVRFEKSGHCLMYEEKEKLAEELIQFVAA